MRNFRNKLFPNFQDAAVLQTILAQLPVSDMVVVDGGARGGTFELPSIANYIVSYGFEPNPPEYQRIIQRKLGIGGYKRVSYSPYALVEKDGSAPLYITKAPGSTSTLRPNADLFVNFVRDGFNQTNEVVAEEMVDGISLATFIEREKLTHIDYLKLDTQGNELDILKSAGELLSRVNVIKSEVWMLPVYQNQALFGAVFEYLNAQGFQFFDLQWTDPCRRYHFSPHLSPSSYRLVWADAYFVRDPFNFSAPRKLEQALILSQLPGGLDMALYIIENLPGLPSQAKTQLIAFLQRPKHAIGRLDMLRFFEEQVLGLKRPKKEIRRLP